VAAASGDGTLYPVHHRKPALRLLIGLCLAAIVSPAAMAAPEPAKPSAIVPERDRAADGRAVQIVLAQKWIETSVDVGRVASSAGGGGLIGAIIIESMDDKGRRMRDAAAQKAEATVAPLRQVLGDFDADALVLATTRAALGQIGWFRARDIALSKGASADGRRVFAASADTPQIAFVVYSYGLSPDFTQIRAVAEISLIHQAKDRARGAAPSPFYRQTVTSVVQLDRRSYAQEDNVAAWAADDGRRARVALDKAFGSLERSIPYALNLTEAELHRLTGKDREKAFGAGFYGPLIARDPDGGMLLWSKGLVHVETLPPANEEG
jgi:hypothetical protein